MVNGGKKFLNGGENFFKILLITCYYVTKVTTGLRLSEYLNGHYLFGIYLFPISLNLLFKSNIILCLKFED